MELSGHAAVISDGTNCSALFAIDDPNLIVRGVRDKNILLLRSRRESEIEDCSAGTKFEAAGPPTFRAAGRRRGMNEEFRHEFALLRKYLNSVASALADIDQSFLRNVDAVEDCKPLNVWRRTRCVIGRHGVITDFAQGHPVTAPAALECTGVHVIYEHALVQVLTLGDVYLMGIVI